MLIVTIKYGNLVRTNETFQKQSSIGVIRKRRFENMQQIFKRAPMPQCDFNKVVLHGCSVNLLHIFRTPFLKNTFDGLLLNFWIDIFLTNYDLAYAASISQKIRFKICFISNLIG